MAARENIIRTIGISCFINAPSFVLIYLICYTGVVASIVEFFLVAIHSEWRRFLYISSN